ncbi:hypothetical protein CVT24_002336 [Panaeolus cyanescens]|uniref:Mid2 domain-containing protein n=1 Tax=Panaeolus cyanescens TaxID=181874 RepID=A0A409YIP9_9AGAR|nr:hypothetical protein CVT24_002336 [Panaeolus cyanescens]
MLLLTGLVAFWTLVAPVFALKFNFTDVQQCDQVTITFAGSPLNMSKSDNVPTVLTILPVNSTAFVFPLTNPAVLSSGIGLTFLPFPSGSNFIASLDNESQDNIIPTSDILRVLPSPTNNASCLPSPATAQQRFFQVASDPRQCEELTVTYDKTAILEAPNVRLFNPKGPSFKLQLLSDDPSTGVATYMMNYPRNQEIILMMDDGVNIRETSPLLTVRGDSASDKSCGIKDFSNSGKSNSPSPNTDDLAIDADDGSPVASRAVIIGGATGGGAVLLIGICMTLFVLRDRRKRRRDALVFNPSQMEKASSFDITSSPDDEKPQKVASQTSLSPLKGFVSNPIYTTTSFLTPTKRETKGSLASWAQAIPEDQKYPSSPASGYTVPSHPAIHPPRSPDAVSMESLDIEGMLNMATLQSEGSSRNNSGIPTFGTITSSTPVTVPGPSLHPPPRTRHLRDPSDVPADYASEFSINPFELNSMRGSILPGSPAFIRESGIIRFSNLSHLPTPNPSRPDPDKAISTSSQNSSDWDGVAR